MMRKTGIVSSASGLLAMTLLFISFLLTGFSWKAEDESRFKEASQEYRQGDFKEAASLYRELTEEYPDEGLFYYNLGNSLHRLGDVGGAILAYERAKFFAPRDGDIRHNAEYVESLLEYRVEDKRNWYLKAAEKFLSFFSDREVISGALFFYVLLTFAWVWAIFIRHDTHWGLVRRILFVVALISVAFVGAKKVQSEFFSSAIITAEEAQVRYGPSDSDQLAFRLKEGLKVYVVDRRKKWSRVLLVNGESGWIRNAQMTRVRPA